MLKYTNLSKPQQAIIRAMQSGNVLKWHKDIGQFRIHVDNSRYKVATSSVNSLIERNYIRECFRDKDIIQYMIAVEFLTCENLEAMEKNKC